MRERNPESQAAELRAAGVEQVFTDRGESSREAARPQWVACKAQLWQGDTHLVIRALDHVAGEERMAIEIIRELGERGVRIRSLTEPFLDGEISTPMGESIVGIMAVMAQLRVSMIRENTRRGLAHARAQGRVGGRPRVMDVDRTATARQLREERKSYAQIGKILGVNAASIYRAISTSSSESKR